MSPVLAEAIDVATDLAWRPVANLPGSLRYLERRDLHDRLVGLMVRVSLSANASAELRFLVDAMRRVARASFSNRRGEPYYERKAAVLELRGCLDVWRRESGRMTPLHRDQWLDLYLGDAAEVLRSLEPESVHVVVTSPPYWNLRDYGVDGQLGLEAGWLGRSGRSADTGSGRFSLGRSQLMGVRLTDVEARERAMLEDDFARLLFATGKHPGLATTLGWEHMHIRPGVFRAGQFRTSTSGSLWAWPDHTLIRVRDRRLMFVELKRELGKVSVEQELVLAVLRGLEWPEGARLDPAVGLIGPTIEVHVWRPSGLRDPIETSAIYAALR